MVNERQEMLEQSATIYFGPWYRRSPFFDATRRAGCTAYDVYNHMLLPAYFDDPVTEYWALLNDVTVWDVGVERTVEISGKDADRFIDTLTCRDLTTCAVKQGKYMIVTAPDGGIVNDPVLLHVGENRWWMQLADSDAGLYALGVAAVSNLDVEVSIPIPMRVQGARQRRRSRARRRPSRPQVLLVRLVRRRASGADQPRDGPPSRASRSTSSIPAGATTCGTRCSRPARSSASGRSPPSKRAGSRPGS
jgi:aminomethyltransferase